MKTNKFIQTIITFTIISILIAAFVRFINYVSSDYNIDVLLDFSNFAISFMYAFCIGFVNIVAFNLLYSKYSWEKDAKKLLFIGVIGSITWSTFAFFIARFIHLVGIEGYTLEQFKNNENLITYLFSILIALIITLVFHAIGFYKALQDIKLKEKTIESQANSARFDALKNQLDPHFLFNSLNVLSALIDENPEKAQDFTIRLSQVYRYVLDQKNKDLVLLKVEINFAKTYLELLKMRFEKGIQIEIEKDIENIHAMIIPLSLQLLIENAIKHNKIAEKNPLVIKINTNKDNKLSVENNLQPKATSIDRNGIGLSNIKSRYALFTKEKCEILKTDAVFVVQLPLLQLQTT